MKTPKRLEPLVHEGLVDEVVRQLMSGKEATVYVVRCGGEVRCAKVYKEANKRNFRQASLYQEGRKTQEQPLGAGDGQGHALRPQGSGRGLAERRGGRRCTASPRPACAFPARMRISRASSSWNCWSTPTAMPRRD